MADAFPEYNPLHIFNKYIYMVSDSSKHHVYIFRFNEGKGALVGLSESTDYFKGVVKPLIFLDDYNWSEDSKKAAYAFDSMDKVVARLNSLSGDTEVSNG